MFRQKNLIILAVALIVILAAGYLTIIRGLPSISSLKDYQPNLVTKVYSDEGQLIAEFYLERRIVVPMEKIPKHLIKAFLAAEDSKFYEHEGISYTSILRAFYKNLLAGRIVQGGSTITQQLAKSFFLTSERKFSRKIREVVMAYRIEKNLNKNEILTLYLNQIYFGNGAYGVQTAAQTYFGKNVEDLNLAEAAMLAGLPKAPSKYSPLVNFELSKKRQEFVLGRMAEEKFITQADAQRAVNTRIRLMPKEVKSLWVGPYFTEHVRRYLIDKYGEDTLYKGGLHVYTTLDVQAQRAANAAVQAGLREYDKRRGYRGPIATLKTDEDYNAFRAEWDRRLQANPMDEGDIYQAVIKSVNTTDNALLADVGSRRGRISADDLVWAKLYNPTKEPDGGKITPLEKVFHPGDVVEVMVKAVPNDKKSPVPLKLEQPPQIETALVAMEPETGAVRALVGGKDFGKTQFNRATQAMRQPGSSFKPIIYAAAMDKNYTPATIVLDTPLVFNDAEKDEKWRPKNYDERFNGPTTVREALAHSRNIITIKILKDIGVEYAISYARKLGIKSPLANDLSLALGSSAVTPLELTSAFATFANRGTRPEPMFVTRITDKEGNLMEENLPSSSEELSPQTAYLMTSLLQGVIDHGTGMRAKALGRPAAGKTGTTNNLNDAWFIGYVPGLVSGVWVGYDDEKQLGRGETGARAALPVWLRFMQGALAGTPVKNFQTPEGIEFAKVDPDTGLLATRSTQNAVFEVFKAGTAPREASAAKVTSGSDFYIMDTGSKPVYRKNQQEEEEFVD